MILRAFFTIKFPPGKLFLWRTSGSFLIIFSSVAPHRGQPAVKCHPRWQSTRRLAVSCGLGRRQILTRDCRTTVRHATTEPPCLPEPPGLPNLKMGNLISVSPLPFPTLQLPFPSNHPLLQASTVANLAHSLLPLLSSKLPKRVL